MVLLRGAERSRRLGITLAVVGAMTAQALWPLAAVERFAAAPVLTVQSILLPMAAAACDVLPRDRPEVSAAAPAIGLIDVERSSGQPPPVAGAVWLEVPVLRVDEADGELWLGAGADLHLAVDMPVAFGGTYLGRLIEVDDERAVVRLVQAADMRTGVTLVPTDEALPTTDAVAVGRRSSAEPLLALIQPGRRLRAGTEAVWRPSVEDGSAQAGPSLHLGRLAQEGTAARGNLAWKIVLDRPAGAEGRVYVLAGAVGDSLVAERRVAVEGASASLPSDGVLGPGWPSALVGGAPLGAVVCSGDRVVGVVAVKRGELAWLRVRSAPAWGRGALAVFGEPAEIRSLVGETALAENAQLYTRGGGAVPRGLWLGESLAPAAGLAPPLTVRADRTSVER